MSRQNHHYSGQGTESSLDYCPFCKSWQGLTYLELCSLSHRAEREPEIEGYETPGPGWVLSYPGHGRFVAYVSHDTCGPDAGYAIELKELRRDPGGWKEHLRHKIWNCLGVMWAIDYVIEVHRPTATGPIDRFSAQKPKTQIRPPATRPQRQIKTYFIQSEFGGHIKIGKSINPESRLKSLQTGRADRLLLKKIINGDKESELHARFKHLRDSGEWFRFENELVQFLGDTK